MNLVICIARVIHYRLKPKHPNPLMLILIGLTTGAIFALILYRGLFLFGFGFAFSPPDPLEIRHRIEVAGAWPVMNRLASERLNGKPMDWLAGLDGATLRQAGVHDCHEFPDGATLLSVQFEFGGADNHHGVLIALPGTTKPVAYGTTYTELWGDGVWYYSEIPPRSPGKILGPLPR